MTTIRQIGGRLRPDRWVSGGGKWLLLVLLLGATSARAGCDVQLVASVPLKIVGHSPLVTAEVNGRPATFILDTGAERSVVTEAADRRLGLARDVWIGTTMGGIGGVERRANADPKSLTLGGVKLQRRTLNHDTSLTVGVLPHDQVGGVVIDGLLGRDFLSSFDLDLDMPASNVTLYRVDGCPAERLGRFLPWRQRFEALPVTMPARQAILVAVAVNGVKLRAMLDTGASATLLAAPGLYRLGLNAGALDGDPAVAISGLGPRQVTMRQHRFQSLQVGRQVLAAPVFWAGPVRLSPPVDLLLGADYLMTRRMWISFASQQVFMLETGDAVGSPPLGANQ